jgi:hypothetical protein
MRTRGVGFWAAVSAALHVALLALLLLVGLPRHIEEPEEQAMTVELVAELPPQLAQGETPAPRPSPSPEPRPPTPEPPTPEPPRPAPPSPPPPPPPPPPAPVPPPPEPRAEPRPTPPSPPQPRAEPRPTPPAPPHTPPEPTPPRPPQPVAETPRPTPPPPAPPRPPQPVPPAPPSPPTPPARTAETPPRPPTPTPPSRVPPPPEPSRDVAGTGQTPPVQRPQERSQSVLNTLERLRATQQQGAPRSAPNPPQGAPRQGGGAPTGTAALTTGEIRGLADQISECWSVDAGMVGLSEIVVELRVQLDGQGNVRNVVPARGVPSDPRARAVYESARRALLAPQCNPLKVPSAKMQTLMASTFRFNPRGLVQR